MNKGGLYIFLLAVVCVSLLSCKSNSSARNSGATNHSTPDRKATDAGLSVLKSARDRALVSVRELDSFGDKYGRLCAPAYCGSDATACSRTRDLNPQKTVEIRNRMGLSAERASLRRALLGMEVEITDEELRVGGRDVALKREGMKLIGSRAKVKWLSSDQVLQSIFFAAIEIAGFYSSQTLENQLVEQNNLSSCLLSFARAAEEEIPQVVTWPNNLRPIFDISPINGTYFIAPSGLGSWTIQTFVNVLVTFSGNWNYGANFSKSNGSVGSGTNIRMTYSNTSNRYHFKLADGYEETAPILDEADVDRLASDNDEAKLTALFLDSTVTVKFRGETILTGATEKANGVIYLRTGWEKGVKVEVPQ